MSTKHLITFILFLTSFYFYYQATAPASPLQNKLVTKIIDGDTILLEDHSKIRLLGINTPEKNQPYYNEAKQFLKNQIQNKTIQLESHGTDKYQRTLSYIFITKPVQLGNKKYLTKNINARILEQGLATLFYYDHDSHYEELRNAEKRARESQLGLWKPSPNQKCISIQEFKTNEPEHLILQNSCNFPINLTYKDDASHIYKARINPLSTYENNFSHIWNTNGDSIYIYDNQGLIKFQRY